MFVKAWTGRDGKPLKVNGKSSWHLRWNAKDPGSGRRVYIHETFHGAKRDAVTHWENRAAEIRGAGAGFVKPAKVMVAEYMTGWLRDYADQHLKPATASSYREMTRLHIAPKLGAVPLAELTAGQVSAWVAELARTPSGRRAKKGEDNTEEAPPMSPRTVAYARAILRAALHEAVRLRMIPANPVELVRAPRQNPKIVQAFTLAEAQALDGAAERTRLRALIRVAWRTGLRLGELLALPWDAVNFADGTITVRQNLVDVEGEKLVQDSAKTRKGTRTVAMTKTVAAELKAHRARQAEEQLAAGETWRDRGLVFCTSIGGALTPRNVTRTYYTVRDAAGLPKHGFHALRHTFATLAKRAGVPVEDIADVLGHESPAFTAKVYAHVTAEGRRDLADRFEASTGTAGTAG